ncbi:hypothetical protein HPB52_006336 [Rhipicephalus sanguineus]|uniref:Secreted protein n=1 Tax=Rhipicephalus sanguineus TaxID=34632 RepID=A0A9D4T5D3_RHISA|nr:hypothetical protein HPB52_006336 [Rhipicephalus sanguineus]
MKLLSILLIFALLSGILATASLNENKSDVAHLRVRFQLTIQVSWKNGFKPWVYKALFRPDVMLCVLPTLSHPSFGAVFNDADFVKGQCLAGFKQPMTTKGCYHSMTLLLKEPPP